MTLVINTSPSCLHTQTTTANQMDTTVIDYHEQQAAAHLRIAQHHAATAKDLRAKAAEAQFSAALAQEIAAVPAPMPAPALTQEIPVFCTADEEGLRKKRLKIEDFKDFVAFSYALKTDLSKPFAEMDEKPFKAYLQTLARADGALITQKEAATIYGCMKMLSSRKGQLIVVAVAGSKGGGLEIRRVTGDYHYNVEGIKDATPEARCNYFHQYETELVRKLTTEESAQVAAARKNRYALVWKTELVV